MVPSLKVPVAVNCSAVPLAIEAADPLMVMVCSVAAVTADAKIFDVIPFWLAVTVLEPTPTPSRTPVDVMVATLGAEDVQVAEAVRFWVLPSL